MVLEKELGFEFDFWIIRQKDIFIAKTLPMEQKKRKFSMNAKGYVAEM